MRPGTLWGALGGLNFVQSVASARKGVARERSQAPVAPGAEALWDRTRVAQYLGVSTRKVQRMEAAGTLRRCPNLGAVVRYEPRDVLLLASASRRKGA